MNEETRCKLVSLEQAMAKEKGEFSLFGLFLREEAHDRWDLLVSAPWLDAKRKEGLDYVSKKVQFTLADDELLSISRIVILDTGDPIVESIHKAVRVKHGNVEVKNSNFSGIQVARACISTSFEMGPAVRGI